MRLLFILHECLLFERRKYTHYQLAAGLDTSKTKCYRIVTYSIECRSLKREEESMSTATYCSEAVSQVLGVPYSTLMHWVGQGLLTPKRENAHGHPLRWTIKDVREALVLYSLRTDRVSLQQIRQAQGFLRACGHNPFSQGSFIVVHNKRGKVVNIVKVCPSGEAFTLLSENRGQLALVPLLLNEDENNLRARLETAEQALAGANKVA